MAVGVLMMQMAHPLQLEVPFVSSGALVVLSHQPTQQTFNSILFAKSFSWHSSPMWA